MHRNSYDSDNTTFSPQGRIHQVEYALEAVKQGSASVGLRSKTHVVLLALKRSTGELASYQKKLIRIDDHIGIAIAGLTSDARVLSNYMRTQAMSSRMLYNRPLPVSRIVNAIADKAQVNTQMYGKRPYGVGFLVAGHDERGPHLYEFSPSGNCFEYYAMSIGARSQSAKTYLEAHFDEFENADLPTLIKHGLLALRDTLQQDKDLTPLNTSIGIVGLSTPSSTDAPASTEPDAPATLGAAPTGGFEKFRIIEGDELKVFLDALPAKDAPETELEGAGVVPAAPATEATGTQAGAEGGAPVAGDPAAPGGEGAAGGDAMETDH